MRLPTLPENADERTRKRYESLNKLITALEEYDLQQESEAFIQQELSEMEPSSPAFSKQLRNSRARIVNHLAKEEDIIPPGYHRGMWIGVGMGAFGVPIGVALGSALENMGLIGIGIPFGLVIGIAIGSGLDKKAKAEGRVLNL